MADEQNEIIVAEGVDEDVEEAILNGLREHSFEFTKTRGFLPLSLHVRDVQNRIVAGVIGRVNWNWLYVELFWVDESLRGHGLGQRLLASLEEDKGEAADASELTSILFPSRLGPFTNGAAMKRLAFWMNILPATSGCISQEVVFDVAAYCGVLFCVGKS